jgi:hypothetical protein
MTRQQLVEEVPAEVRAALLMDLVLLEPEAKRGRFGRPPQAGVDLGGRLHPRPFASVPASQHAIDDGQAGCDLPRGR